MSKDYGQFCGLAKAARVLGERWALLIIRDLSIGSRRFKDLHDGLPGVPTSVLTTRLRELEEAGVVERRAAAPPHRGVVYELTPYGRELQPALDALGRWGALRMAAPEPEDIITGSSLAAALRAGYQPGAAAPAATYLVHAGPATAWARTEGGELTVGAGPPEADPDLVIRAGPQLRLLLAGQVPPAEALRSGAVEIDGPPAAFEAFAEAFHVPLDDTVPVPG